MDSSEGTADTPGGSEKVQDNKPKRVRTGCLTCRTRHLKCDEEKPVCRNCRKANRPCETGIRLNWLDTQVKRPPLVAPPGPDYQIAFVDDSREIASEYAGGLAKYGPVDDTPPPSSSVTYSGHVPNTMPPPSSTSHQSLPPIQGMLPEAYPQDNHDMGYENQAHRAQSESSYTAAGSNYGNDQGQPQNPGQRDYLTTQEEVIYMQVYVDEVGLWMDSMDPMKHFSRLLPFQALKEPMLLTAFLACGALHMALVNKNYTEEKALYYYDTATRMLLSSLEDPNRNSVICATTAVILNVFEIMNEKALQRMNHIAGARALIKECGWNARSTGVGAACFWLNLGMEILSCLHFNWQVAWNPDEWQVDMDFSRYTEPGREEMWCYRMLYIIGKIANFRATVPKTAEQMRAPHRIREWEHLKKLINAWNESIPRTMHPMSYLYPALSGSAFPEVWMIKRTSTVARLFYHTGLCLLGQIHPLRGQEDPEMASMVHQNAVLLCGIVAHVKDRGVASVALRSLAIAAECLTEPNEQQEILLILDRIRKETGWRIGFLCMELKKKWGWTPQQPQPQHQHQHQHSQDQNLNHHAPYHHQHQNVQPPTTQTSPTNIPPVQHPVTMPPVPPPQQPQRPPPGIMNPMYATADFNLPQHPYQQHYVAPNAVPYAQNPLAQLAHQATYY